MHHGHPGNIACLVLCSKWRRICVKSFGRRRHPPCVPAVDDGCISSTRPAGMVAFFNAGGSICPRNGRPSGGGRNKSFKRTLLV
eukprot:scaffold194765_cov30-Tisochrysis_lutea.AAC.1